LRDEAVALGFVEPLHGTGLGRHGRNPIYRSKRTQKRRSAGARSTLKLPDGDF
jgi:hypothetical protein